MIILVSSKYTVDTNDPYSNSVDNDFRSFTNDATTQFNTFLVVSVVFGVIGTVATVVIILAVLDCLKKAGSAIPAYARIATAELSGGNRSSSSPSRDSLQRDDAVLSVPQIMQDSQVEAATIEMFLGDIEREKPIRFSSEQLANFTHDYSNVLGSGGFGVVFKGELPASGVHIAVKVLNAHNLSDKRLKEQFMAEVSTIGRTYHLNLVRLYGFCFEPSLKALVYEYMENGSLERYLFSEEKTTIDWGKLNEIAIGTAKGIAYLHEECRQRIIHYDIKPGNVLLDANLNPKVADFGLAKLCSTESGDDIDLRSIGFQGTPGYAAPELWRSNLVTYKCDVYSFGILLFEIVGRRKNFDTNLGESRKWLPRWTWEMFKRNELAVLASLCEIEEADREKAERMAKVALWCVQYLPEDRPNMSTVVKMLEGLVDIAAPPNPFLHLEAGPSLPVESGSSWSSSSASKLESSTMSSRANQSPGQTFEIEVASSK